MATSLITPLAWEPPYAMGETTKKKKKDLCVLFSIRFDKEYSCILIFAVTVNGILFLYFLIVSTSKTCRYLLTNH